MAASQMSTYLDVSRRTTERRWRVMVVWAAASVPLSFTDPHIGVIRSSFCILSYATLVSGANCAIQEIPQDTKNTARSTNLPGCGKHATLSYLLQQLRPTAGFACSSFVVIGTATVYITVKIG